MGCGGEKSHVPLLGVYDFEAHLHGPGRRVTVACEADCPKEHYELHGPPELTAADVRSARADVDPATSQPVVLLQFTAVGQRRFRALTPTLATRGRRWSCPQHLAIVVSREIVALAYIDFKRNPEGIPGDNGVQLPTSSLREARELARDLNSP